jgi:sarcosine oxidase delta subunit
MGMYDSIYLQIKCPFCGQTSEMECQTKELDCELKRFRKGDNIDTNGIEELDCIVDCHSRECMAYQDRQDGYSSGFGRLFYVIVDAPLGLITGKYKYAKDVVTP